MFHAESNIHVYGDIVYGVTSNAVTLSILERVATSHYWEVRTVYFKLREYNS